MSRYVPTAEEQACIDRLRLAGYAVVRQRTYDNLQERLRLADHLREWDKRDSEHVRKWAHEALDEQRRLADRLNQVCYAAAAEGVTISAINDALAKADRGERS